MEHIELINNRYQINLTNKLGSGGFSEVFLGTDNISGEIVAVKTISLNQKKIHKNNLLEKLDFEIKIMQELKHPNIVEYRDVVKTDTHWYIIMEYCNSGTLSDVIKFNNTRGNVDVLFDRELNTYYYLNQLKNALKYVLDQGYVHRDVKPINVLITGNLNDKDYNCDNNINYDYSSQLIVKLADFGLTREYSDGELMKSVCGSPLFMAPEILLSNQYNSKADIWSFGIIMYMLLYGNHPINITSWNQLKSKLESQQIDFHTEKNLTNECFELIKSLLAKNPVERISWYELFDNKWFMYWKYKSEKSDFSKKTFDIFTKSPVPKKDFFTKSITNIFTTTPTNYSNLSRIKNAQRLSDNYHRQLNNNINVGNNYKISKPIEIPIKKSGHVDDIQLKSNGDLIKDSQIISSSPADKISPLNLSEYIFSEYEN
ncbi:putative serine/threonine-protein kinase [Cotonvirus japonicus]|uniref:Serine/threonine-protein kinase n=1 Tax=Cotonvirus japonicus TaxID=2811091 RepID=A0ABM7NT19_9VIRU|nr:putative serine/threonine-protein kinase [Cotonvirus japonicus]BCS83318.1 putative serine/threonine-protein kinase [Cotonvirus japonicus]